METLSAAREGKTRKGPRQLLGPFLLLAAGREAFVTAGGAPALRRDLGLRCGHRHGADSTFGKILAFDSERVIIAGSIVLPGNAGCQLHQLGVSEPFAQTRKQRAGNFDRSTRHRIGIFENQPLQFREVEIRAVVVQIGNLFGGDAICSADGRADVNSKWASD